MRPTTPSNLSCVPDEEIFQIASEAYVFGYPLVLMDITRRVMSNFSRACKEGAPMNQFLHRSNLQELPFASFSKTNLDMTCSTAWLDLINEPFILSVPDMGKRYHMMHMLDAWTNVFASPGTRTTGNGKTYFVITGPNWKGSLPMGLRQIKSPTNLVLLVGHTQINDQADCAFVRRMQTHYKLAPLSAWDRTYFPPDTLPIDRSIDMTTSPDVQLARMDSLEFFRRLASLLRTNPAASSDSATIAKLAGIGILQDNIFPAEWLSPHAIQDIRNGAERGRDVVESAARKPGVVVVNNWAVSMGSATYGTDYLRRAAKARSGVRVDIPEDAIYLRTTVDSEGNRLSGENCYVLHFPSKKAPPIRAFWSLSMYDNRETLVENQIHRYTLSSRDALVLNSDNSLDLYIQHESPYGQLEANWLPAPPGEFNLVLRLYWPNSDVWEGRWLLPGVRPADMVNAVAA